MTSPHLADVECPECGGTGRVPQRAQCQWCRGSVAEHMCADCEMDLCEDCIHNGRCLGCQPLSAAELEALLLPDPVTGREVAA